MSGSGISGETIGRENNMIEIIQTILNAIAVGIGASIGSYFTNKALIKSIEHTIKKMKKNKRR